MTDRLTDVRNCPRCAGEHAALQARKFDRPSKTYDANGEVLSIAWWAICPVEKAPILATVLVPAKVPA